LALIRHNPRKEIEIYRKEVALSSPDVMLRNTVISLKQKVHEWHSPKSVDKE
jgi:hypothetical protein